MILRKDYVKAIQDGKAQVEVEKTEEHNEMLNLMFPKRVKLSVKTSTMDSYFKSDNTNSYGYMSKISKDSPFENLPIIHASDIILDNTVIKVESEEHGKRVIEWWKKQGVENTEGYGGNYVNGYYGIRYGHVGMYYENEIEGKKIITLPETFPSKWYMKITNENKEVANEWRESVCGGAWKGLSYIYFILSKHMVDSSFGYGEKFLTNKESEGYSDYSEITTDQFLEHVYRPWKNNLIPKFKQENKMRTIAWQEAQELIDMVDGYCGWKAKLSNMWALKIVLRQEIKVSEELMQQGRKEASQSQKEVIDRIFGKEKEEIDLYQKQGIGKLNLFQPDGDSDNSIMAIFDNNRIWLNPLGFKWKLDKNILTIEHE